MTIVYPRHSIEKKLGVDVVRSMISDACICDNARELVTEMAFSSDYTSVCDSLEKTAEMYAAIGGDHPLSLTGLCDTRQLLGTMRIEGSFVDLPDLLNLRVSLRIAADVKGYFSADDVPYPKLKEMASEMFEVGDLLKLINSVVTREGTIKDNASPRLSEIRHRMSTIQGRLSSAIRRVLNRAITEGIVDADTKPSVRDGRLVLPVASMNKRRINGIVHDESATGKTFFIEPAEIVELNNEQRELEIEERREIVRILTELTDSLRPYADTLAATFSILYEMDFIRAKAVFANRTGGNLPHLHKTPVLEWFGAKHPILRLSLEAKGRHIVPLSLEMNASTARILVVSGPNAGGKSVVLKTIGVNQYLAQCGVLPVMDANSHVGIFDAIFVDIGDDQSIEDDLSTYSSHLRNMKFILSHGDNRSLVLIDEFGSGTEPQIGGAIAQALLEEFNAKQMWCVVTTHYQNLKQFAQETDGVINGSMVYDRQLMQPTFRLAVGSPGSSFAVDIALRSGLPKNLIDKAEAIVGSDYFNLDKYLLDINRDRRYWENKRNEIKKREKHLEDVITRYEQNAETLRQQRHVILQEAKDQAAGIIAGSNAAIEKTIREIRKIQAEKEQTKVLRSRLSEKKKAVEAESIAENKLLKEAPRPRKARSTEKKTDAGKEQIKVGDNVLLDKEGQPATVVEINKDKAVLNFGSMKMTVPVSRLSLTLRKASTGASSSPSVMSKQTTESSRQRQLNFKGEIDVRGMRADEAIQAVTYFIDDALQFNVGRVRILHGTGTGALRMAIRQYLATVGGVRTFHDEDVRFGGAGITVVEL